MTAEKRGDILWKLYMPQDIRQIDSCITLLKYLRNPVKLNWAYKSNFWRQWMSHSSLKPLTVIFCPLKYKTWSFFLQVCSKISSHKVKEKKKKVKEKLKRKQKKKRENALYFMSFGNYVTFACSKYWILSHQL